MQSELARKILKAAVDLIAEQGVRAMSFREVARRAGVSHQAPYHHFGSAEGILREIAREGFSALAREMAEAGTKEKDSVRALEQSGGAYIRFALAHPGHFRVMFQNALVKIHDEKSPLKESEATYDTLVGFCRRVQEEGRARHMSLEILTSLSWALVHGLATLLVEEAMSRPEGLTPNEKTAVAESVIRGLGDSLRLAVS
ncbi:TetR/AcrR family transcriptional regulator [bacterium]|nr:TetR/AcrR family transcriptional regulator [bacterium]